MKVDTLELVKYTEYLKTLTLEELLFEQKTLHDNLIHFLDTLPATLIPDGFYTDLGKKLFPVSVFLSQLITDRLEETQELRPKSTKDNPMYLGNVFEKIFPL